MERVLRFDGLNNFRDLGGYTGADGRRVKWRTLFRSDHFAAVSEADLQHLQQLGIQTLFDFRSPAEQKQYPNLFHPAAVVELNPMSAQAEEAAQAGHGKSLEEENRYLVARAAAFDDDAFLPENSPIAGLYRQLVSAPDSQAAYRSMLQQMLQPETAPLVMHCRGGKDRTGYAAALVLQVLGVSQEDIVSDYMLTGHLRKTRNEFKMNQYRELTDDPRILDYLYALIDTKPAFILTSFAEMERLQGSVSGYMDAVLGMTPEKCQQFRELYLE